MRFRCSVAGLALALFATLGVACSASANRVVHVAVVSAGGATAAMHDENVRVYRAATDALRAELRADGGRFADYDARSAALDGAFRARSAALVALDAALYDAAAVLDAVRAGGRPAAYGPVVARTLQAVDVALHVLGDGALLPAVHVPPVVTEVVTALRAFAPVGAADAG